MPVFNFNRYSCPVTYLTADSESGGTPDHWFVLNGETYAPQAQLLIAQRIMAAMPTILTPAQILAPASAAELTGLGLPVPEGVL